MVSRPTRDYRNYTHMTTQEVIRFGHDLGVPRITVQQHIGEPVGVLFHWHSGTQVIYPRKDVDMDAYTPQPGDIGLTQIEGRVGQAIRIGQWLNGDGYHDYQHAFVYVGDGCVVEAMPQGARLARLDQYTPERVLWLRCPAESGPAVATAAQVYVGVPYSFVDYAALALRRFRIPAPHLKAYIRASGRMICSQLCDQAAQDGGWHIFQDHRWPGEVTPGDLTREALRQEGVRMA